MTAPFVVLEALDGVGKTTLARGLAAALGGVALDTPGAGLRGVREAVLAALPDQDARCLFYAASVLAMGRRAAALASAGTPVVMDRYWLSTRAYARARGVTLEVEAIARRVVVPDATVLVTLDEAERQRRLRVRGCTAADRETLQEGFRSAVLRDMRRAGRLGPTVEVDVTGLGPEACVGAVLEVLAGVGCRLVAAGRPV